MRILKQNSLLRLFNSYLVDSPQPSNISYMWNFGSLLALCLGIQIVTGIFLVMHYAPTVDLAFNSVEHIMRDVNYGWLIRYTHANVASFFFIFVYAHIGRGLYYNSYRSPRVAPWSIGVIILVLMIATAFLGYVLPYGQMSLWGEKFCLKCDYLCNLIMLFIVFIVIYLSNNKIAKRIRADARIGPHNFDILSIIYGSLLGDSHAERRLGDNGTRIGIYQEANHSEYLLWLHHKIATAGYCNPSVPKMNKRLGSEGKIRHIIRFHTYTYTSWNQIHVDWYLNGIKRVPKDIYKYLTPLALTVWICDEGGRVGSGLKLSTNSFSFEDTTRLALVLHDLYGIKSSVQKTGVEGQFNLYIWSESMQIVRDLVKPYMVSSMLYKLGDIKL